MWRSLRPRKHVMHPALRAPRVRPGYLELPGKGGGAMKRIIVIVAALLTLAGVSAVYAPASLASVCQPNGIGCTKAGTYSGPNAVIDSNYTGFRVTWTKSV